MGRHKPALLERMKSKRLIVLTAAAGAVLVTGGTAGAAVVGGDLVGGSENAASNAAAGPPEAETAKPVSPSPAASSAAKGDGSAEKKRDSATKQANQAVDAKAKESKKEEPKEEGKDEEQSQSSGGGSGLTPSGESGSCEMSMYSEPQATASGETFDPSAMTAAHKTLPMDTMVKVTNPDSGKSVTVRINDRGPYVDGRCLDLSTASFTKIASEGQGVADVDYQVVS